jgi:hypothetical protein
MVEAKTKKYKVLVTPNNTKYNINSPGVAGDVLRTPSSIINGPDPPSTRSANLSYIKKQQQKYKKYVANIFF